LWDDIVICISADESDSCPTPIGLSDPPDEDEDELVLDPDDELVEEEDDEEGEDRE
jgi:hypothetical protein